MKMKNIFSAILVGMCLLLPTMARAQTITLRVEPGLAVPITEPQDDRFKPGAALAIKPELGLGHYFSLGPSLAVVALPSTVPGVDTGTVFGVGGFVRLKRPHNNHGRGLSAMSPWVDADAQYIRTGPLDRFGWAAAVGASVPTSESRQLWVGPFVRYQNVYQEDKPGFNTNNAKIVIVGLSFEVGAAQHKKVVPEIVEVVVVVPPPVKEVVVVAKVSEVRPHQVTFTNRVQFAWDSAVLTPEAKKALEEDVAKGMFRNHNNVRVEGHASSEGQVKHNDALSARRAQAVVDFLVAHGVSREKLSVTGFGSRFPVMPNDTKAGRVANRRVEFNVTFVVTTESSK